MDPEAGDTRTVLDEHLLKELQSIDLNKGKNFVVLQMYGSHENYKDRYPPSFGRFRTEDYRFPQNAAYDNSILYTDHLLNQMIGHVAEKSSKPAYFIYMSDHGECQGEEGEDIFGHLMFRKNVASTPVLIAPIHTKNDSVVQRIMNYPYMFSNYFLSLEIARLLGYDFRYTPRGNYLINGVDLCGMDGYARAIVNDSCVVEMR
jgi:membrane-anchored protein YejM (alkaline phosphatase superfamily)